MATALVIPDVTAQLAAEARRKSLGSRGKKAEELVEKLLDEYAKNADFAYERYPDARAGSMKEALADYVLSYKGKLILLEVKEVEHICRLPHGNFKTTQVARMRRYKLSRASAIVVVHFKPLKAWRGADIEYFKDRVGGSWDMSDLPAKPLAELLELS